MYFLSEESVREHKAYLASLKLKYSILEKSIPRLKGVTLEEIYGLHLSRSERREAVELYCEIRLHEVFFSSFSEHVGVPSRFIQEEYGSCASFIHEMQRASRRLSFGFACYCILGREGRIVASRNYEEIFEAGTPVLALDVFEHAYFRDFGFDKGRYIASSLSHLDLSLVDKCIFG